MDVEIEFDTGLAHTSVARADTAETDSQVAPAVRGLGHALEQQRLRAGRALFGAGPIEMTALEWLFLAELTPTQLADRLQVTTASITGLVDRLAAQQLVDRHPHPQDRRKILVALTDQARDRMADWFTRLSAITLRATEHLDPPGRRELVDNLHRITAGISADHAHGVAVDVVLPVNHQLAETLHRISNATTPFTRPGRTGRPAAGQE